MKINVKASLKLDTSAIAGKLTHNNKVGTFLASEWHKLISPFTPKQTGNLIEGKIIKPYAIQYTAQYANKMYFGKTFNFRKDKNPKATSFWSEKAEATQKYKLIDAVGLFIEREKVLK